MSKPIFYVTTAYIGEKEVYSGIFSTYEKANQKAKECWNFHNNDEPLPSIYHKEELQQWIYQADNCNSVYIDEIPEGQSIT